MSAEEGPPSHDHHQTRSQGHLIKEGKGDRLLLTRSPPGQTPAGMECPPTRLITYMRRGGLGGSCSLEHGSLEAMEAPGGDAAPAGFCKGKSVGRAPQALPQLAGWGWGCLQQGAGGLWLGLSLSHFLLLWVLPLPPLTHPPPPLGQPAPHAAPQGTGVPEWNHVSGEEQSQRQRLGEGLRAAARAPREL